MKTITQYVLKFALSASILTIIFRYFLSCGIENKVSPIIISSAIIYGVTMFILGWVFGKKDREYLPIFDVGFRFHLTTYIVHNGISLLWIGLGFGSKYELLNVSIMVSIYWGSILLIHAIFYLWARKKSIRNLNKNDLFE